MAHLINNFPQGVIEALRDINVATFQSFKGYQALNEIAFSAQWTILRYFRSDFSSEPDLLAFPDVLGYGAASAQTPLEANADEAVKGLG